MAVFIDIDSKQHKKEHFVYVGDKKIGVHPLGPDMHDYENVPGITIYALRGWYYISHEDRALADSRTQQSSRPNPSSSMRPDLGQSPPAKGLTPRSTRPGF